MGAHHHGPTSASVMLGLEPSIHTASVSSSRMDPRLKAWDDGGCGWRSRQLAPCTQQMLYPGS
ncbi:hypothetical protein B5K03_12380 [Rhizobium phaseoli]|nr:hypothetical protein B5K03_12380 [Rhizobium phaseoli]